MRSALIDVRLAVTAITVASRKFAEPTKSATNLFFGRS